MGIFRLADHEAGRQLTLEHRGVLFGHVAVTYHATPRGTDAARLLVKLAWAPLPVPVVGRLIAPVLAAGDLVMMRRQLLNLGALAERDAAARPVRFAGPS
jgi:hypothetical protein